MCNGEPRYRSFDVEVLQRAPHQAFPEEGIQAANKGKSAKRNLRQRDAPHLSADRLRLSKGPRELRPELTKIAPRRLWRAKPGHLHVNHRHARREPAGDMVA